MAAHPVATSRPAARVRLRPFHGADADVIVTWVTSPHDTYWLAPRTAPPLTREKVRAWGGPLREQLVLATPDADDAIGYGEVNVLHRNRAEYWLGHIVLDPRERGRGLGVAFTEALLRHAFRRYAAVRVTLVVFEENVPAVRCYRAAGMHDDGHETHFFPAYQRYERLLRLAQQAPI